MKAALVTIVLALLVVLLDVGCRPNCGYGNLPACPTCEGDDCPQPKPVRDLTISGTVRTGARMIRGARVELLDVRGSVLATLDTDEAAGAFARTISTKETLIKARICAINTHVQVNMMDDARLESFRCIDWGPRSTPNSTATLDINITASRYSANDVGTFRAFDSIFTADRYVSAVYPAMSHQLAKVIPCSACYGLSAPVVGGTDIWVSKDRMTEDDTVIHEFGHYVQNMTGTLLARVAIHDGCGVGGSVKDGLVASASQNDAEYAMFEGFPTAFARRILNDSMSRNLTSAGLGFYPTTRPCPFVGKLNSRSVTTTPDMVEHYMAGLLFDITNSPPTDATGKVLTTRETLGAIIEIFDGMSPPTFSGFRQAWLARFTAYNFAAVAGTYGL